MRRLLGSITVALTLTLVLPAVAFAHDAPESARSIEDLPAFVYPTREARN